MLHDGTLLPLPVLKVMLPQLLLLLLPAVAAYEAG